MHVEGKIGQKMVKLAILAQHNWTLKFHSDIITVAHAIDLEGFKELTVEHVAGLTAEEVLNEEEITQRLKY